MNKKIYILFASGLLSFSAYGGGFGEEQQLSSVEKQGQSMTIDITLNYNSRIQLQDIPTSGFLEVYSILGIKVTSINLRSCANGCTLELPKGIYILKAGKVAKKILAK